MRIYYAGAILLVSIGACLAAESPTAPARAAEALPQGSLVPDTFTNLQVLPKDISKNDLVRIMKSFAMTMDKRCSYCHVATDDLSQADFPSDKKETKRKTRELLQFILATQKK